MLPPHRRRLRISLHPSAFNRTFHYPLRRTPAPPRFRGCSALLPSLRLQKHATEAENMNVSRVAILAISVVAIVPGLLFQGAEFGVPRCTRLQRGGLRELPVPGSLDVLKGIDKPRNSLGRPCEVRLFGRPRPCVVHGLESHTGEPTPIVPHASRHRLPCRQRCCFETGPLSTSGNQTIDLRRSAGARLFGFGNRP